jgi:pSer/pThr/pTyr-binding forkhead associated (FHA) protein
MQATLIGVDEQGLRRRYHLTEFPVTVGRNEDADVHLSDPRVSGLHCKIDLVDGTLIVEDTFSRNGTRVNGCYVRRSPLMPGDELAVGMSTFQVAYERCSVNAPPQACYTAAPDDR